MSDAAPVDDVLAKPPLISVTIGSYNGARTIRSALAALQRQRTDVRFEVIVVDDASTDDTAAIAREFGVKVVSLERNVGHGATLNVGLHEAAGTYVALMDDDCVPPDTWIQQLADAWAIAPASVTMIGGVVRPLQVDTFNRRYVAYREPLAAQELDITERTGILGRVKHALVPRQPDGIPHAVFYTVGANTSVRVSAARDVGGFTSRRGAGEEESIARPLRRRFGEATVRLYPDIVMYHDFDPSLRDTVTRARHYGSSYGREWAIRGGIPTVPPVPALVVSLSALAAVVSPLSALLVVIASPYVLYRRWYHYWRHHQKIEVLSFPLVQLLEDIAGDYGFALGVLRTLQRRDIPR